MEKYRRVRPAREPLGSDEIRVTASGRVGGYLSYANTLLTEQKMRQLTIKASGNAIGLAINLVEQLKRRYKGLHQLNKCGNTTVCLVYEPLEEGLDQVTDERVVAFLEIKLSFEPLDENDPGYQPPYEEAGVDIVIPLAATGTSGPPRGRGGYRGNMRSRGGPRKQPDSREDCAQQGEAHTAEEYDGPAHSGGDGNEFRNRGRGRGGYRGMRGGGSRRGRGTRDE